MTSEGLQRYPGCLRDEVPLCLLKEGVRGIAEIYYKCTLNEGDLQGPGERRDGPSVTRWATLLVIEGTAILVYFPYPNSK